MTAVLAVLQVFLKVTRWTDEGKSLHPVDHDTWVGDLGNDNLAFEKEKSDLELGHPAGDSGTGSYHLSAEDGSSIGLPTSSSGGSSGSGSDPGTPIDSRYSSISGSSAGSLAGV